MVKKTKEEYFPNSKITQEKCEGILLLGRVGHMSEFNIKPNQNYIRLSEDKRVFTGQQILNLLELSKLEMQAVILLDIWPTDQPATNPKSKYGV